MTMIRGLAMVAVVLLLAGGTARAADPAYWTKMSEAISADIAKAEALALSGKGDEAKKIVTEIYFSKFETGKMEAALRKQVGSKHAFAREKQFVDLRKLVVSGPPDDIKALAAALRAGLAEDGKVLDAAKVGPDVFAVNQ